MTVVLFAIAVLVAGLLAHAMTESDRLSIDRAIVINVIPEKIFPLVNDFHKWDLWAPRDVWDPTVERRYSGPESGRGAQSVWQGAGRAGRGRMEIIDSVEPTKVKIQVDLEKPFRARHVNEITFESLRDSTLVRWRWNPKKTYGLKVMSLFIDTDAMMGKRCEAGLANLKALLEPPPTTARTPEPGEPAR